MQLDLSPSEIRVVHLLGRISQPVGYFGLALRLSHRRRLLKQHLAAVLASLIGRGLVSHQPAPGQPFDAYALTAAGRAELADLNAAPDTPPP